MGLLILTLNLGFGRDGPPPRHGAGPAVESPPAASAASSAPPDSALPDPTQSTAAEPTPTEDTPPAEVRAPLTVLNHSRISGLAAKAAEDFRTGGWDIVEVGNTRLDVAVTTVFFEPGQEPAAASLRAQFPAVRRSAPRPDALAGTGLTVVVTREYPA